MPEPLVLLVEDEALILIVAQDALEAGGYAVMPVTGSAAAMDALDERSGDFAGLVTDVRLGAGPNGWDVARHARELKANLPVVYTTGDSAVDWPVHGVPNSVVIQKPYAEAQLVTAISTLITQAETAGTS